MRLLLTTDTVGGVWTFTSELTRQLLERGHAVALVSFGRLPSAEQSALSQEFANTFGDTFCFQASDTPLEWMQENARAYSDGVELLCKTARCFGAELLHANQFCWGALPGDLPRLITAHSDVLSWVAVCRPQGIEESPWLAQYRLLVQQGINGADALVAPTSWMQGALLQGFEYRRTIAVIPNGRTLALEPGAVPRKLQAVSAGRLWDEAKGMQILQSTRAPFPMLVAGEERFEDASAGPNELQLMGKMDARSLLALFRSSSIYIATSIYEPFGLAPLEAALCGCAVVARDIPSLREVWGEAALFYTSPEELTEILAALASSSSLLQETQQAAIEWAQKFSAERMTNAYLKVYGDLLSRKRDSVDPEECLTHVA